SSDPFVDVTVGGPVRHAGKVLDVLEKSARTKVPELLDYKNPKGSSVDRVPIKFTVWDWNSTGDDLLGQWKGTLGDLAGDGNVRHSKRARGVPVADGSAGRDGVATRDLVGDGNPHSKRARGVPGADGSAGRDGVDSGGWVFLELVEQIIGKDVPGKIGIKVALSEEGKAWQAGRNLVDESKGMGGFISRLSLDGNAGRVVWQAELDVLLSSQPEMRSRNSSIGAEKNGVVHPDGWESPVTYAIGRGDNYFLQMFDERPRQHGELFLFCHVGRAVAAEHLPLEPHRYLLFSGSDDECIRVWDLHSHTAISEMCGEHTNK
ncbi:hypothetical protein T484DRAFT_1769419, partial [Baffinella frigidus]